MPKERSVMLAPNTQLQFHEIPYPMLCSPKVDGIRLLIRSGELLTRSLRQQPNVHLKRHLKELIELSVEEDFVFEAELYAHRTPFPDLSSILRSHRKHIPSEIEAHIFDGMHRSEWEKRSGMFTPFELRIAKVRYLLHSRNLTRDNNTQMLDQNMVHTHHYARMLYDKWITLGYEGLMAKKPSSIYKHGRATTKEETFFKFKQWTSSSASILGFVERREMLLGASGSRGHDAAGYLNRVHQKHKFHGTEEIGAVTLSSSEWPGPFRAGFARGHTPESFGLSWYNREEFLGKSVMFRYQPTLGHELPRMARIFGIEE